MGKVKKCMKQLRICFNFDADAITKFFCNFDVDAIAKFFSKFSDYIRIEIVAKKI